MEARPANPILDPAQYATKQLFTGPPATRAAAGRLIKSYEYVIVGAGCAGCVLASKLSEDENVSVLLLEAGPPVDDVLGTKVPALHASVWFTEHDWRYRTVEQPELGYRRLNWPRGRMLGGSTSMNSMIYHHCAPSDFDEWKTVHGCDGWAYDDMAPYFRRMERFAPNPDRPPIDMRHRGDQGEWDTGYAHLTEVMEKGFIQGCVEAGIPAIADINTPDGTMGVTPFQSFIDPKGQRASMATAYLTPAVRSRPNLFVACGAPVSKVLWDRLTTDTPTAIGVELQTARDGDIYEVHARREVILCGGAINTPQTLLLSGVGPAAELARHRIPVVTANEAVGANLKDHLCPSTMVCKAAPGASLDHLIRPNSATGVAAMEQWTQTGRGPMSSNVAEAAAFVRADRHRREADPPLKYTGSGGVGPDVEILAVPLWYQMQGLIRNEVDAFTIVPISLRPLSSGTITLQSRDPFDHPIIDPKYLSDPDGNDLRVLIAGTRLSLKIAHSDAMKPYLERIVDDDPTSLWWPYSSSDPDNIPDDQLVRFMKERAYTLYHPVGSARMGPDPATSVVGLDGRVHGVGRLRVMDASVFPEQVSGHPTAPIAAMAYKLSDVIKGQYAAGGALDAV